MKEQSKDLQQLHNGYFSRNCHKMHIPDSEFYLNTLSGVRHQGKRGQKCFVQPVR